MRRHEAVHCLAWDSSLLAAVKACHFALRRKWQVLVHGATGGGNDSSPFCLHVRMLLMMLNAHKRVKSCYVSAAKLFSARFSRPSIP